MLISIIIPTYNTALLIERTLCSVLKQQGEFELEILIVDDCSTDNTLDVIRAFGDERIKIFRQEHNQGPAAARNKGLHEAKGEYCAFLDGDDYWEQGFLSRTSVYLNDHPNSVAVFTGQCHKSLGKPDSIRPRCVQNMNEAIELNDFYEFWNEQKYAVCTGSVLMRTVVIQKLGGQMEELRVGEDLEFWLLLATQGLWGFIPEVLFVSDGMVVNKKIGWLEKNLKRWKSAPPMPEWEKRIIAALPDKDKTSYNKMRGEIAMMLQYCMIASDRDKLAFETQKQYGMLYDNGNLTKLYRWCAFTFPTWKMLCVLLRYREYHRNLQG